MQHPLWSHLLGKGQPTLIVPADSGLVLYHNVSGRYVSLNDYLQGTYRDQKSPTMGFRPDATLAEWMINLADRRYTSVVDLNIIDSLERLVRSYQSELQVRYARDVRPNDLKSGNTILLGASEANPWVELYERNLNFVFHNDYKANVFSVINRSPLLASPVNGTLRGTILSAASIVLWHTYPISPAMAMPSSSKAPPCRVPRGLGILSPTMLS